MFTKLFSNKYRAIASGSVITALVVVPLLLFVFLPRLDDTVTSVVSGNGDTSIGLSITYLPITPQVARQFDLDVSCGTLI